MRKFILSMAERVTPLPWYGDVLDVSLYRRPSTKYIITKPLQQPFDKFELCGPRQVVPLTLPGTFQVCFGSLTTPSDVSPSTPLFNRATVGTRTSPSTPRSHRVSTLAFATSEVVIRNIIGDLPYLFSRERRQPTTRPTRPCDDLRYPAAGSVNIDVWADPASA